LNRFFSLHYVFPFIVVAFVLLHLSFLHISGSSNPISINTTLCKIDFYPYFVLKDIFSFLVLFLIFSFLIFYYPNILNHPDNYIKANPLITPLHIVPEFYFLPFYAILRAIPSKLGGVICMFSSLICLILISFTDRFSFSQSGRFKFFFKILF
jgi:ubiquinol-cytochrome c reductase cytochrome b subunit